MVKTTKTATATNTPLDTPILDTTMVVDTPVEKVEKVKKTPTEKKVSEKKSKASKVVVDAPVDAPVDSPVDSPVDAPVEAHVDAAVDAPVVVDSPPSLLHDMPTKIADFNNKYNQVVAMLSSLKQSFKSIEKSAQRDWRISQKALAKKNKKADKRSPSGFVRPCLISDEMAVFLGVEVGTMIARTSVSKLINLYIRNNNLQDKTHGRNINPDEKLSTLLNIQPDSPEKLTYFNLQRYMKHHFIKTTPVVETVETL
jgi:chromatin remodeling complex protein RSC6